MLVQNQIVEIKQLYYGEINNTLNNIVILARLNAIYSLHVSIIEFFFSILPTINSK